MNLKYKTLNIVGLKFLRGKFVCLKYISPKMENLENDAMKYLTFKY